MVSQQLLKLFVEKNRVATNLLKYNVNKTQISLIFKRKYSKSNDQIDAELNKPIQYTTSPANNWKAEHSRFGSKAEFGPWYEPHLVNGSIIIFMIYFFILREENDIDLLLEQPLSETFINKKK